MGMRDAIVVFIVSVIAGLFLFVFLSVALVYLIGLSVLLNILLVHWRWQFLLAVPLVLGLALGMVLLRRAQR